MNRRNILGLSAITGLGLALLPTTSFSQQKPLAEQIVGTWTLVSYDGIGADGARKPFLSATPKGTLMFDAKGNYVQVFVNPDRPKTFSGKTRDQISADDYKSAASGLIAQFGTWTLDEPNKTLTTKVGGALNPALAGTELKIVISLTGDELKLMQKNVVGVTGTDTEIVFSRVK